VQLSVRQRAAVLSAIAAFGFAAAPVLHAELHLREDKDARRSAVERLFELAFLKECGPGYREQLAAAAEEAFGTGGAGPGALHHRHSHPGKGAHGDGAQEHFMLAFRPAPPPPPLPQHPRVEAPPAERPAFTHLLKRYLVPSLSQGPPRA
jgi:hypothetical protein